MCQSASHHHPPGHQCACRRSGRFAPDVLVPAGHDLEYPETPFPPATLLATVGEKGLRTLVRDHHTRLREDAEIGHLFARDDTIFLERVEKIADFVVESCGGPTAYSEAEGPDVCMRTRHFPFEIDERAREIWLEKLFGALAASDFPTDCRRAYWKWMEAFSVRMINRRRTKAQPLRFSYDEAVGRWAQASVHQPSRHATAT